MSGQLQETCHPGRQGHHGGRDPPTRGAEGGGPGWWPQAPSPKSVGAGPVPDSQVFCNHVTWASCSRPRDSGPSVQTPTARARMRANGAWCTAGGHGDWRGLGGSQTGGSSVRYTESCNATQKVHVWVTPKTAQSRISNHYFMTVRPWQRYSPPPKAGNGQASVYPYLG